MSFEPALGYFLTSFSYSETHRSLNLIYKGYDTNPCDLSQGFFINVIFYTLY